MPDPTVFISSTFEDLKTHRAAAKEAAVRSGFAVRMMEYFAAGNNPPLEACLAKVDEADLLIALVAQRFGWVPDEQPAPFDERKSITWLEVERAVQAGKDVLAFLLDDDCDWPAERCEENRLGAALREGTFKPELVMEVQRNLRRLDDFKRELGRGRVFARFNSPETLAAEVERALREWRAAKWKGGASEPSEAAACDPARYLAALAEDTASIDIRGLIVGSGQAHRFAIDDLYIPLTTMELRREKSEGRTGSDALAGEGGRVELEQALRNRRLVIIGDPGAGKTTFLRRIANVLCRAANDPEQAALPKQKLGIAGQPLPIFLRIWELAEHIHAAREQHRGPTQADSPGWLVHYLQTQCRENRRGLTEQYFAQRLAAGEAVVLLDGLDEAPSEAAREQIARVVAAAANAYPQCRFVVTSRPAAYEGDAVLKGFQQVQIDRLDDAAIAGFLGRWYQALFPDSPRQAERHRDELLNALRERPEIHRLARNPVMLTALGVVHWNERRLPEQRADLYESIITWLSRSRKTRPGRPAPEATVHFLQELALAMQTHAAGRQVQCNRRDAAEVIARECRGEPRPIAWSEAFLTQEELDSGIVVRRGDDVRFWHLTFQEYLAARAIAARPDAEQVQTLNLRTAGETALRVYDQDWREMILLLAGVLFRNGRRRVDQMFSMLLGQLPQRADLADQARCIALLGAAVQDLTPVNYQPGDPRYHAMLRAVFNIFDRAQSSQVPLKVAIAAADALGQAGDPRFSGSRQQANWIDIPAGEFLMGSQKKKESAPNYDAEAEDPEMPAHPVFLDAYRIAKYPVTVAEYARFVADDGYEEEKHWAAGGFGQWPKPGEWEEQLQHPNRPVVNVSWFEASAYAAWAGCRLPTEAEWERAARGTTGRKYPWGNEEPDERRLNYWRSDTERVGHPTPVGLYPRGDTPEGISDMAGNVWEWCADWFGKDYYGNSPKKNPQGPDGGSSRVVRGGSWHDFAFYCRAAYRLFVLPLSRYDLFGVRVVLSAAWGLPSSRP